MPDTRTVSWHRVKARVTALGLGVNIAVGERAAWPSPGLALASPRLFIFPRPCRGGPGGHRQPVNRGVWAVCPLETGSTGAFTQ